MGLRKLSKNRCSFPSDEALTKLFYLALRNISQKWSMPIRDWKAAPTRFCIYPAVSAQVRLLKHKPQRGSSCPAPDEGAGGYKSRSNLRSHDWRAAVSRSGAVHAFVFERSDHALDHAVLLRAVRGDELLLQAIAFDQGRVAAAGEHQTVV